MKLNNNTTLALAGLAVVAISVDSANAVSLEGNLDLSSPPNGGVIFEGFGIADINGNSLSNLDFIPPDDPGFPEPGGTGAIEINASPDSSFFAFIEEEGTIEDLPPFPGTEPAFPGDELDSVIEGFINVPDTFRFDLSDSDFPTYSESLENNSVTTTVSIGLQGTFVNLADSSNDVSSGIGTLTIDFVGLTQEEIQELYNEPGETFGPLNWTANFVATAEEPVVVPEQSSIVSLIGFALTSSIGILLTRTKKS